MDEPISREDCLVAVKNSLRTSDFVLEDFALERVGDTPIGFMARHLRLTVRVRRGGETETLIFFTKTPPSSEAHRTFVMDMEHFRKEITMYEKLVPVMSKVLPEGVCLPIPRCYYTREEGSVGGELIVMEDVTERGYRLRDKMLPCDVNHCRQVLRAFARFHAPSFILQNKWSSMESGKSVEEFFSPAKELLLAEKKGHLGYTWSQNTIGTMARASAGFWPERFGSQAAKDEITLKLKRCWKKAFELAKRSRKYSNVLCHGDPWTNNMMFLYGEKDGGARGRDPLDALLVDLQLIRYAPPTADLLLFFHCSTTREFRRAHMRSLLVEYHGFLEEIVTKEVLDTMMPLDTFLQCVEEYGIFGVVVGTAYLPVILVEDSAIDNEASPGAGEPLDFVKAFVKDQAADVLRNAEANEMYKQRLSEGYQECLELLGLWN